MFLAMYIFVILQRLVELWIAKKNEVWMKARGALEVGQTHYKYIVLLHVCFFLSLFIEVVLFERELAPWWSIFFLFFLIAQVGRGWTIASLGRYWNTKIMIIPGSKVVTKGPYRFIRHPNYVIVSLEIFMIPLIFQAYVTAFVFTILNSIVLMIRIRQEEAALRATTNYGEEFSVRNRFFPYSVK